MHQALAWHNAPSQSHAQDHPSHGHRLLSSELARTEPAGYFQGVRRKRWPFMSLSTLPESRLYPNLDVFNSKLAVAFQKLARASVKRQAVSVEIENQKTAVQGLKLVLDAIFHASLLCRHAARLQG